MTDINLNTNISKIRSATPSSGATPETQKITSEQQKVLEKNMSGNNIGSTKASPTFDKALKAEGVIKFLEKNPPDPPEKQVSTINCHVAEAQAPTGINDTSVAGAIGFVEGVWQGFEQMGEGLGIAGGIAVYGTPKEKALLKKAIKKALLHPIDTFKETLQKHGKDLSVNITNGREFGRAVGRLYFDVLLTSMGITGTLKTAKKIGQVGKTILTQSKNVDMGKVIGTAAAKMKETSKITLGNQTGAITIHHWPKLKPGMTILTKRGEQLVVRSIDGDAVLLQGEKGTKTLSLADDIEGPRAEHWIDDIKVKTISQQEFVVKTDVGDVNAIRYGDDVVIFSGQPNDKLHKAVDLELDIAGARENVLPKVADHSGVGGGAGNLHQKIDTSQLSISFDVGGKKVPAKVIGAGANGIVVQHPKYSNLAVKIIADPGNATFGNEAAKMSALAKTGAAPKVIGHSRANKYKLIVVEKVKGFDLQKIFKADTWKSLSNTQQENLKTTLMDFAKTLEREKIVLGDFTPRNLMASFDKQSGSWNIKLIDAGHVAQGDVSYTPQINRWFSELSNL